MGYEIPQELEHKERILFGLTFKQLGWASIFGLLALLALTGHGNKNVQLSLAAICVVVGVLFVFFDLATFLQNAIGYLRHREALLGNKEMHSAFPIKKVENNTIVADDTVAVLRASSINFGIKTDEEKESIIVGFQKFLNSLNFPIQMLITTEKLSMENYLMSLEKRTNDKALYTEFANYIKTKTAAQRNREFYIIIPQRVNVDIQAKLCEERLRSLGLQVERLTDAQILSFLAKTYKTQPRTPPEGASTIHHLVAPSVIRDHADYLEVDGRFVRVIAATGYPRNVESGFLDKITSSNEDYDISLHIEPFSIETTMVILNQELQKQRADLYAEEQRKSISPSLEIKYRDTLKVLEALQKGEEKLFNVSLLIACKATNEEELDLLTRKEEAELQSIMIIPNTPLFRQMQAYKTMMPFGKNYLSLRRNVTTKALSAFFPFTSPFLTIEPSGTLLGLNKNNVPYIKDIFKLNNANGVVLATSGAGKSYFTKLLISRQLLNNTNVTVIDPQGEYRGITQACNGELVTISRTSKTIINPMDLMGHDYVEKRLALQDLFQIMFGELSEVQKSILDRAVNDTYARFGITADSYNNKKPPQLRDLYKTLAAMDKTAAQVEKATYRAIINRLYMYTEGVFNFLDKQSNIDYEKPFVCFNIGDMPKQVKPVVMFLILDYAYMTMKQRPGRKLLVVDEAWSLLSHAEEAGYLFEIVKTCRKFNMGLLLITQDVADLLSSSAGHAVLANSSYTFLLRQKPAIIDSVTRTFHLSQAEKEFLLTATQGKGILMLDNDHQELTVIASEKEHELISTNPNEKEIQKERVDNRVEVRIELDTTKGLHYASKLDIEEINYLGNRGYEPGYFVPTGKPRQEECYVKTNKVEGIAHTFLVENIIEVLKPLVDSIEKHITEKPDIVYRKNGVEYAIEVETGASYRTNKRKLKDKLSIFERQYDKRGVIVLTDNDFKRKYQALASREKVLLRADIPGKLPGLAVTRGKTILHRNVRGRKKPTKPAQGRRRG